MMTRREDLKMFSDCEVIAGEEVAHQHRLVCGVVQVKECKEKRTRAEKRIWTWKLTGDVGREFKDKVNRQHRTQKEHTANEMWIDLKGVLISTAEELCGTPKGARKLIRRLGGGAKKYRHRSRRGKRRLKLAKRRHRPTKRSIQRKEKGSEKSCCKS